MLKGVIFDFNGTLFFDSEYHLKVFDQLRMEIAGKHLTMEELDKEYSGLPNVEIFKKMSDGRLSEEECESYSQRKEAMYRDAVANTPGGAHLCNGAEEMFDLLKENNIPFTIASASIIENIAFFRQQFHLDKWIDPKTIVYDDGSYKNKVAMFQDAMKRLGIKDHVLVFEDSKSGILSAEKAGASVIAIKRASLHDFYQTQESILAIVHDLSEAIPDVKKMMKE